MSGTDDERSEDVTTTAGERRTHRRRLTVARSVLLALADLQLNGPVTRPTVDLGTFRARYAQRCDDCGLGIEVGDEITDAFRQGRRIGPALQPILYVHAVCPAGGVLFQKIEWLRSWDGADVVSAWVKLRYTQQCVTCRRTMQLGEHAALVRRPGPILGGGAKHSDWKCERCVEL